MEKIKVLGYDWEDGCDNVAQSAKCLNRKINLWMEKQKKPIRLTKPPVVSTVGESGYHVLIVICYEELTGSKK